jgi:hypothetical protein
LYQKQYLNAIQTTCPWILRYLSTAVITNKSSRRNVMKDLIKAGLAIKDQPKKTHLKNPLKMFFVLFFKI